MTGAAPATARSARRVASPAHQTPQTTAQISETVLRIAVLLEAGVSPTLAWDHLARLGDPRARAVSRAVHGGVSVQSALSALAVEESPPRRGLVAALGRRGPVAAPDAARAWRDVAAAWGIATTVGAPLAQTLRGFAEVLRDAGEATDEIHVALAEPTATARLMGWLPAVGIGLAIVLGFDPIGTLAREPAGWACAVVGVCLLLGARRWSDRLARAAYREAVIPGMDADLTAIALQGGVSVSRARELVERFTDPGERVPDPGETPAVTPAEAPAPRPASEAIGQTLELSEAAGVPAVELLRSAAALERHRARVDGRMRAARLSSRLLLPLGVCTLPAFLCLGVAPMFLSILPTVTIAVPPP